MEMLIIGIIFPGLIAPMLLHFLKEQISSPAMMLSIFCLLSLLSCLCLAYYVQYCLTKPGIFAGTLTEYSHDTVSAHKRVLHNAVFNLDSGMRTFRQLAIPLEPPRNFSNNVVAGLHAQFCIIKTGIFSPSELVAFRAGKKIFRKSEKTGQSTIKPPPFFYAAALAALLFFPVSAFFIFVAGIHPTPSFMEELYHLMGGIGELHSGGVIMLINTIITYILFFCMLALWVRFRRRMKKLLADPFPINTP